MVHDASVGNDAAALAKATSAAVSSGGPDQASWIINDPNDWSREIGNPRYILDLLARVVTVSIETVRIVKSLPALDLT